MTTCSRDSAPQFAQITQPSAALTWLYSSLAAPDPPAIHKKVTTSKALPAPYFVGGGAGSSPISQRHAAEELALRLWRTRA